MKLTLKYFASLRESLGAGGATVAAEEGSRTTVRATDSARRTVSIASRRSCSSGERVGSQKTNNSTLLN